MAEYTVRTRLIEREGRKQRVRIWEVVNSHGHVNYQGSSEARAEDQARHLEARKAALVAKGIVSAETPI